MGITNASNAFESVARALDRHQQRRLGGTPTLSVLAGPVGLGLCSWRRWALSQGLPVVQVTSPDLEQTIHRWIDRLVHERDLTADAITFLATRLGLPAEELGPTLASKSPYEMDLFLEIHLPEDSSTGAESACRWLLKQPGKLPPPDQLAGQLNSLLTGNHEPWLRVFLALHPLLPSGTVPTLLGAPPEGTGCSVAWIESSARLLARIASLAPELPVALVTESSQLAAYHREVPESSAKAVMRETVVEIGGLEEKDIQERFQKTSLSDAPALAGSIHRLAADGASPELVESFQEAAAQVCAPPTPEGADRARSAAERFLFERLESLPQTGGLFSLNVPLGFSFGKGREAEADLASTDFMLAIEIDGYYHFQDRSAYRRDRRKDAELQKHGFLVLRFLAEDVVTRLEEILETVLTFVALRQKGQPSQERNS